MNLENLNVKSGVHTVAKVFLIIKIIKKRFGASKTAAKQLKKLVKLNKASRK
jgi:hypothetical protein